MAESVPVRCPDCRRGHLYSAPAYPCVCGAPVAPPLDRLTPPTPVTHRTWDQDWVTVRCPACGREDQWPQPELGCPCGTLLRIPVTAVRPLRAEVSPGGAAEADSDSDRRSRARTGTSATADARARNGPDTAGSRQAGTTSHRTEGAASTQDAEDQAPAHGTEGRAWGTRSARVRRTAFQPVTIRTARDAVTAAALYLRWLGYRDIQRADQPPPSGLGLAARGILAQVDPTVRAASLRDVECLWLTAMSESSECVYFSLAGYTDEARLRADTLGVPLFVLDLTGTPQPVNSPADDFIAGGA